MPNKPPLLPPEAEAEILGLLFTNMRISSGDIAAILAKHGVYGDIDVLQDSYRKRLGQRLMSSIRDEKGNREVLAHGSDYVVVGYNAYVELTGRRIFQDFDFITHQILTSEVKRDIVYGDGIGHP